MTKPPYEHEEHETPSAEIVTGAPHEQTSLLQQPHVTYTTSALSTSGDWSSRDHESQGHSHDGSMNMKALVLHVLGDALGNVGVIATGLIIWLTSWSFKYYCDPIISLIITVIICHSALPLGEFPALIVPCGLNMIYPVRSTSFILLQGVPPEVSLEDVRARILAVEGVFSVHELHIWQLSETKIIASVHINVPREVDFMRVASEIRQILVQHGIHSSTIQPEYRPVQGTILEEGSKVRCPVKLARLILNLRRGIASYHVRLTAHVACTKHVVVSWKKIFLVRIVC